jgi:hypothetical protein
VTTPVIHQTDLFHPPADPDDHWDLACSFALAARGEFDLRGVVIDYPPRWHFGDPAVGAVAQLSQLTGVVAPLVVGATGRYIATDRGVASIDESGQVPDRELLAARFIVETLRRSSVPVTIGIAGSCRDVALAADLDRDAFAEKCAAVYVNAGVSDPERTGSVVEYNVMVDPLSFRQMFNLPCDVRWLPAFDSLEGQHPDPVARFELGWSSRWTFEQGDVLSDLSEPLRRYFEYAMDEEPSHRWLQALTRPTPTAARDRIGRQVRRMWCTAGFFHAAGWGVREDGELVTMDADDSVFAFLPIEASCDDNGFVTWEVVETSRTSILRVRDVTTYPAAMRLAMARLLRTIVG